MASKMPKRAALVSIHLSNSFHTGGKLPNGDEFYLYMSFVPTDSTETASFNSFVGSGSPANVYMIASRPSFNPAQKSGVMVEVYRFAALGTGDVVTLWLAQTGATTYGDPVNAPDLEHKGKTVSVAKSPRKKAKAKK